MEQTQKKQIAAALRAHLEATGLSQNEFSRKHGVSSAYVSQIAGEAWGEYPKAETFQKVAKLLGLGERIWPHYDTDTYQRIQGVCRTARGRKLLIGIDGQTGAGKTYGLEKYNASTSGTVYIKADPDYGKLDFLRAIAEKMGYRTGRARAADLKKFVVTKLTENPDMLLIIDEAEYMTSSQWNAVKSIYDHTKDRCGIVIAGLGIQKYIERKSQTVRGAQGWQQIRRRMRVNWLLIKPLGPGENGWYKEVQKVCAALPLRFTNPAQGWLAQRAENYDDLRHYCTEAIRIAQQEEVKSISPHLLDEFLG